MTKTGKDQSKIKKDDWAYARMTRVGFVSLEKKGLTRQYARVIQNHILCRHNGKDWLLTVSCSMKEAPSKNWIWNKWKKVFFGSVGGRLAELPKRWSGYWNFTWLEKDKYLEDRSIQSCKTDKSC